MERGTGDREAIRVKDDELSAVPESVSISEDGWEPWSELSGYLTSM
jgi:hypothetical protein